MDAKARLWYDEIEALPDDWDTLANQFKARFCIYGQTVEEWYEYWSKLHFDPSSDQDIEDLITDIKALADLCQFGDQQQVTKIKSIFPQHRMNWFQVQERNTLFQMLRALYPKNRNTPTSSISTSGSFTAVHKPHNRVQALPQRVTFQPDEVIADAIDSAVDRLGETVERIALASERRDSKGKDRPRDDRSNYKRSATPPFKPYLTKGRRFNRDRGRDRSNGRSSNGYRRSNSYQRTNNDRNERGRSQSRTLSLIHI